MVDEATVIEVVGDEAMNVVPAGVVVVAETGTVVPTGSAVSDAVSVGVARVHAHARTSPTKIAWLRIPAMVEQRFSFADPSQGVGRAPQFCGSLDTCGGGRCGRPVAVSAFARLQAKLGVWRPWWWRDR